METQIKTGDCLEVLQSYSNDFFDLIITSPPYADSRSHTYGGIKPAKYVKWFLPRAKEFFRVLKPEGSFVLNIKERVVSGERSTYVLELILAMKKSDKISIAIKLCEENIEIERAKLFDKTAGRSLKKNTGRNLLIAKN